MPLDHVALVALVLCSCATSTPPPNYPGDTYHEDVSVVLSTLEEAYGPKALIVPVAWQHLRRHLESLDISTVDRRRFCDVLGSALTEFRDPALFVTLEPGEAASARCHAAEIAGHVEGVHREGADAGVNVATESLYEVRREGLTTVVGVRHFEPRGDARWAGFPVFDVRAPAILLDLRGAGGTDPRAVLDRLWGITQGRQVGFPLRRVARAEGSVAEAARARAASEGYLPRRDFAVWNELVGPPRLSVPRQPQPIVSVLIDGGCEEACQLVARVLEVWADATIVGTLSTRAPISRDDPGIVILPNTGIALHFPTSAYLLNWGFVRQGSGWRTRPQPGQAAASFEGALRALNYRASTARRVEELAETGQTPCAEIPAFAERATLPSSARERLFGEFVPSVDQTVTITMDLPEAEAREWLGACPEVALGESSTEPDGSTIIHVQRRPPFTALSRVLGNEATRAVTIHSLPIPE